MLSEMVIVGLISLGLVITSLLLVLVSWISETLMMRKWIRARMDESRARIADLERDKNDLKKDLRLYIKRKGL